MKKHRLLLTILYFFSCTFFPALMPNVASAQEDAPQYACAVTNDVFFYSSPTEESGLFLLPYTYYVKILSYGTEYCNVQYLTDSPPYKAVYGYCKTNRLKFVDFTPVRPYLYYTFEATYVIENGNSFVSAALTSITLTYVYYGDYLVGSQTFCYVGRENDMGYLPKTYNISYELNDDCFEQETSSPESSSTSSSSFNGTGALVIVLVAVFLVCILFFFLPKKQSKKPWQENE